MNLHQTFLFIFAHPDDEAVLTGGTLAEISKAGGEIHLAVLTDGKKGIKHVSCDLKKQHICSIRKEELAESAQKLGVRKVHHYSYPDGSLIDIPKKEIEKDIIKLVNKIKPDTVVTFGPTPYYPHNDHITTRKITLEAISKLEQQNLWHGTVLLQILPDENIEVLHEMRKERSKTSDVYAKDDTDTYEGNLVTIPVSDESFEQKMLAIAAYRSQNPENFTKWIRQFPIQDELYIEKS